MKWMEDDSEEARREVALLKLLGLFDRPATADCVAALRQAPAIPGLTEPLVGLAEDDWEFSLSALRDAKLLTVNREEGSGVLVALDAHPLLREYFATAATPAAARGLARRAPAALRTPLRDHEGQATSPRSKTSNRSTRPWPTAARRGCSRRRVTRFTTPASSAGRKPTASANSARSVPTWEPSPASSSRRGAASRPRSRKPPKPGC